MPFRSSPVPVGMNETIMANKIAELEAKVAELVVDANEATDVAV